MLLDHCQNPKCKMCFPAQPSDGDVSITLKRSSWENIVRCIHERKMAGNFWAAMQRIEAQLAEDEP